MFEEIVYPKYLRDESFKNRNFTLNIIRMKSLGSGVEEALDRVKQRFISGVGTVKSDNPKEIIKALEDNYNKMVEANTEYTIVLPLPNTFTDSQSHSWSTETGIIGTVGQNLMNKSASDIVSGGLGSISSKASSAVSNIANKSGLGDITVNKAIGSFANESGLRKPMADPGYFQNYNGSQPRSFRFSFDLIAQSPEDALSIQMILLKLKEYSSPEMSPGGVSILSPCFFDLKIGNALISSVANTRGLVLTNIDIDYGADGGMQFLPDGTPKYIKLNLAFNERTMLTANHFRSQ